MNAFAQPHTATSYAMKKFENLYPVAASGALRYSIMAIIWSLLLGGSLLWNMSRESQNTLDNIAAIARANISKDLNFREWGASHGGVYIRPTENTPPNPYLDLPERDVVTTTGEKLTLMNPAYMLRELQSNYTDDYGTKQHITSLKLLNPKNAPDAWEAEVLRAFEQGEKERQEVQQIDGQPYLRLMRPLIAEPACLKCHGKQGYKAGDIRGGISTSVPMAPHLARAQNLKLILASTHGVIWLIGLAGLGWTFRFERKLSGDRRKKEREIEQLSLKNQLFLDSAGEGIYGLDSNGCCTFVNPAASQLLGFSVEELIGKSSHAMFHHTRPDGRAYPQEECPVLAAYKEGAIHRGNDMYWRKDGSNFQVEFVSTPIVEAGKTTGAVVMFRDITERRKAEEELRTASLYSRSLIEASLDPLVTISKEGKITDVNKATEEATGRSRADLVGTDFSDYFTEPDVARAGYAQVFEQGFVTDYPLALRHRDGHVTDVAYNASLYRNKAGEVLGVFAAARDVTERKKAEKELRRSEQGLAEAQRMAHLGNWSLDIANNMLTWSDEIYRIFEIDPEKFGASYEVFLNAIHPEDRDMVNSAYTESVKNRKSYDIVHRLLMKDGRVKYVHERCETHYGEDGKPLHSVGTVHDITEQKVAEIALTALKDDLENRVMARTTELASANQELEAFSYSVSHDLRTPLRAIDGFSLMLLEDYADKLDDEGKRLLNVVRNNTSRMSQLIDDILRFSRAGRTEITFVETDMERVVRDVLDELKPLIDEHKVRVNLGDLPQAMGDRAMMHQVIENLLSNAIKFSGRKEGACIDIGGRIEGDKAIYYVKDNGVGFDMQYADKLFGVFQRLHGVDEFEGTGIGLAIVKRIITRQGGAVWAEGEVGKGATFYFSIPAPSQHQPQGDMK